MPGKKAKAKLGATDEEAAATGTESDVSNGPVILACTAELGPTARQEWHRSVAELTAAGSLRNVDRGPLALYCFSFQQWREAISAIQKYGSVMKSPNDYPVQSPYVSIAKHHADTMMRIATEFGFTPASRLRMWTPSSDGPTFIDLEELRAHE